MDGYFERGEIYWISMGYGSEMIGHNAARPAVIVSNDNLNRTSQVLNVCYLTTSDKSSCCEQDHVFTRATGKDSWILCESIATVDKSRIGRYMAKLGYTELRELQTALENVFDLGYDDDPEKEKMAAEIEQLKQESKDFYQEKQKYITEIELLKKSYDAAIAKAVEIKVAMDLESGVAKFSEKNSPIVITEPEPEQEQESEPVLNVNTARGSELRNQLGMTKTVAYAITSYRNEHGDFKCVNDLLHVPRVTQKTLDEFRSRLTV